MLFVKTFCESMDFELTCIQCKCSRKHYALKISDHTSLVAMAILDRIDMFRVQNRYVTEDFVKHRLAQIVIKGDNSAQIKAAKILLGLENTDTKTINFTDLLNEINDK